MFNWEVYTLDFKTLDSFEYSEINNSVEYKPLTILKGKFNVEIIKDALMNGKFTVDGAEYEADKFVLFVNGFNLGRLWRSKVP